MSGVEGPNRDLTSDEMDTSSLLFTEQKGERKEGKDIEFLVS